LSSQVGSQLESQTENQPGISPEPAPAQAPARPSLLGGDTLTRADSILLGIEKSKALRAELDKAAAPKSALAGLPWILGASGVLAAGALWWVMGSAPKSVGPEPVVTAAVASRPAATPAASASTALLAIAAPAASAVMAANTLSPVATAVTQAASTAPLAVATAAAAGVPSAIVAAAQTPKPAVKAVALLAKKVATPPKLKPRAKTSAKISANTSAKPATKLASKASTAKPALATAATVASTASAAKQRDPDADLLTAMLGGADNDARIAAATAAAAPGADASLRRPDTIAGLVGGCTAMADKAAGRACRQRICDGYWGKAQACAKELAPGAVAGKKVVKKKVNSVRGKAKKPVVKKVAPTASKG
jgi:hypothetical protein